MFKAMDKYRMPAQILLGAIGISFVGFGLIGFQISPNNNYIIKIGEQTITRESLDVAVSNTQSSGDNAADREQVFQTLVSQAYLLEGAKLMGLTVSDEQIKQMIVDSPEFHNADKQFDPSLLQEYLMANNMNEQQFMTQQRNRMLTMNLINLLNSNVSSDAQAKQLLNTALAERTLRSVGLNPEAFVDQVKVNDVELQKFYNANKNNYVLPKAVKFQYVVLSPETLLNKQTVSETELKEEIEAEQAKNQIKRRISHILIATDKDKVKAKAQAEKIAAELKTNPEQFAELARKYSQDEGTAANGGDLGEFARNGMGEQGKVVEDTAFALNKGEVSGVVESHYGYHIVRVTDITGEVSDEDKKAAAEKSIKEKKAQKVYAQLREELSDLAFSHPNELKTAANKLGLTLQAQDTWLTEANANELKVAPTVVEALFGDEVFNKKHNSDPISLDKETWVVRALETRPESTQPFTKIKEQVKEDFIRSETVRMANEEAKKFLTELQAGKSPDIKWSPVQNVSPIDLKANLTPEAYKQLMTAVPKAGKPAYVMIDRAGIPELVQVEKIASVNDEQTVALAKPMLMQAKGETMVSAYIDSLRRKIKTEQGTQTVSDNE